MLNKAFDYLKKEFRNSNAVNKLLLVNISFFVVVVLINFADWLVHQGSASGRWGANFTEFFSISSYWPNVLKRIWSIVTSIFLHARFGHILFNLFALILFGNIVGDLIGDRRIFPIYLLGGLVGNIFFMLSANVLYPGTEHIALGASGAIMALAGAAVVMAPDYRTKVLLLGNIPLKYIVLFMILADLLGIAGNYNTGGHFAHLGGLFFGVLFMLRLYKGHDMSEWLNQMIDRVRGFFGKGATKSSKPRFDVRRSEPAFTVTKGGRNPQRDTKQSRQETLDAILDKIRLQGLASLTEEEKRFLDSLKDNA